jgi:membrane protein YdbS with pleckstrin-like domain
MKSLRPHRAAWIGAVVRCLAWTAFCAALWCGFAALQKGPRGFNEGLRLVGVAAIGGVGLLCVLRSPLAWLHERYEIGATEITVRTGALWQTTTRVKIEDIVNINVATGPFDRLLGVATLDAGVAKLRAIPAAAEVRQLLLERRDALREAARAGDRSVACTPHDLLIERLCEAVERLEKRL